MNNSKIIVFAGAGLSATSGIPTLGETGGLLNGNDPELVSNMRTVQLFQQNVFDFYNDLKNEYLNAEPSDAHYFLADLQREYGIQNVEIYTSNVDYLLENAGCVNVRHLCGDLEHSVCWKCRTKIFVGDDDFNSVSCPKCKNGLANIKPGVLFCGEFNAELEKYGKSFESDFYQDQKTDLMHQKLKLFIGSSFEKITVDELYVNPENSVLVDKNKNHRFQNHFQEFLNGDVLGLLDVLYKKIKMKIE